MVTEHAGAEHAVTEHAAGERAAGEHAGAAVRAPGRPRSEKAEKAIIDATVDLLAEGAGVSDLSIEAIAARAGVGKTTIYRRWSNKEDLVVDALATLKAPLPDIAGMSVRESLVRYLQLIHSESGHPRTRCIMNVAMNESERHPHLMERFRQIAIEPRRVAMRALLQRGVDEGELRPDVDVDVAMAAVTGTMLYYTKWGAQGGELPADLPEQIVDHLFRGLGPGDRPA
jgi:AcrR family transcriptional regulator